MVAGTAGGVCFEWQKMLYVMLRGGQEKSLPPCRDDASRREKSTAAQKTAARDMPRRQMSLKVRYRKHAVAFLFYSHKR